MISVSVLDIQRHPDPDSNPDDWTVRFQVNYEGTELTFWRWHKVRDRSGSAPTHAEAVKRFWEDTFAELHGFSFRKDKPW